MHYCQACSPQRLMTPHGTFAQCDTCGETDPCAQRMPLVIIIGASGSGKTAIFPHLIPQLTGQAAVFDVDWLIDPLSRQGDIDWAVFRDTWLHVAHGVAQNGLATVLLAPFLPEHLQDLPGRTWVSSIHYIVLDCSDTVRRQRLEARPDWRSRDIDAQLEFAAWLRANLTPIVDTNEGSPLHTAQEVASICIDILGREQDAFTSINPQ